MMIGGYNFEGPWILGQSFNEIAGVYVIYTSQDWLDVGETNKLEERISNHERKPDWVKASNGLQINIVFYINSNSQQRQAMESYLRGYLKPVCGER